MGFYPEKVAKKVTWYHNTEHANLKSQAESRLLQRFQNMPPKKEEKSLEFDSDT